MEVALSGLCTPLDRLHRSGASVPRATSLTTSLSLLNLNQRTKCQRLISCSEVGISRLSQLKSNTDSSLVASLDY